jgi:UDP-glucose 4-epimerase
MQQKPVTIFGDGRQTRAFSYIGDVAPVLARSIERPQGYNQVFNIGADTPYSVLHLAETVARAMGSRPEIKRLEPRKEVVHAFSSHDKAKAVFGDLMHNVSLEEGIDRMVSWAKIAGIGHGVKFGNIEVERNLPKSWKELAG